MRPPLPKSTPNYPFCGCWFWSPVHDVRYMPQVQLDSHTTILATTSRTRLLQTFHNPLDEPIKDANYVFPLYDGVSVAGFTCTIQGRVIVGKVKEKSQARVDYQEAVSRGETAGLLEQDENAADVFTTSIGNVPAGADVLVEITYLGELKNDAETDGARFTIPTSIAPRYGARLAAPKNTGVPAAIGGKMKITVDITLESGSVIRRIQSPSHPIAVTMGTISTSDQSDDDAFENNLGSATLALGGTALDKDFVVVVQAKGQDTPRALLETHPTLSNQRALMATLVPKFNIPNEKPEIVFVVDRSGSMGGKMQLVIDALKVFLKSLPVSVKFNICSFGSHHSFLFKKSQTYDATSLQTAMEHIDPNTFINNYGGTEMMQPIEAVLKQRYKDLPLEVMLLTDGEIWNQGALFEMVNKASKQNARFFTVGIGSQASTSLVEGIARAGRGFSQWVHDGERIDKRIVRMLKGALSPHINYKVEIKYRRESVDDDDFEMIESFEKSMRTVIQGDEKPASGGLASKFKISLFNSKSKDEPTNPDAGKYDHLPTLSVPSVLQTPYELPELFPHSRATIYLLLGPDAHGRTPEAVVIRGTSAHGDLELEIPVQDVGQGETIHKLAAKKAAQELEEGRGWLMEARSGNGKTLKSQNEGNWDLFLEREAVRLGTTFQVAGKFCSFVAVEKVDKDGAPTAEELNQPPPPRYQPQEKLKGGLEAESCRMSVASSSGMMQQQQQQQQQQQPQQRMSSFRARRMEPLARGESIDALQAPSAPAKKMKAGDSSIGGGFANMLGFGSGSVSPRKSTGGKAPRKQLASKAARRSAPSGPPPPPARAMRSAPGPGSAPGSAQYGNLDFSTLDSAELEDESPMDLSNVSPLDKMSHLITLQTFSGSWSVTDDFLAIVSHGAKDQITDDSMVKDVATRGKTNVMDGEWMGNLDIDSCATVLAIAWLETVMADENDVWEMVVEKARAYLESRIGDSDRVSQLLDGVRDLWQKA